MKKRTDKLRNAVGIAGLAILLAMGAGGCATHDAPAENFTSPAHLLGTEWWVEDIAGGGVVDRSRTTIGFPEDQRVAGNTGCNNYTGSISIIADRMTFGTLAGTSRACVPAIGNQEVKFYATVNKVKNWEVTDSGSILHLRNGEGETIIRASRITPGSE